MRMVPYGISKRGEGHVKCGSFPWYKQTERNVLETLDFPLGLFHLQSPCREQSNIGARHKTLNLMGNPSWWLQHFLVLTNKKKARTLLNTRLWWHAYGYWEDFANPESNFFIETDGFDKPGFPRGPGAADAFPREAVDRPVPPNHNQLREGVPSIWNCRLGSGTTRRLARFCPLLKMPPLRQMRCAFL